MKSGLILKLLAWGIALTLVALPIVGVLNGWFAADRWPIRNLKVHAEFAHLSGEQIRSTVATHIAEGFFALNLDEVHKAIAALPWVARVEAHKRWPDTLELTIHEQQPFAHWGDTRLIDHDGTLFKVPGSSMIQGLPQLSGPDEHLAEVLAFYTDCVRAFTNSGLVVSSIALSDRGSWRLGFSNGAMIEMGHEHVKERLERFLSVWPRLASVHSGTPAVIDLRYSNGFALRWTEPFTQPTPSVAEQKPANEA